MNIVIEQLSEKDTPVLSAFFSNGNGNWKYNNFA